MTANQKSRFEKDLSQDVNDTVSNFEKFGNGFSFTTSTELGAYKAAYKYQHSSRVNVEKATPGFGWLVQVYNA